jgi:hypothetical protein
MKGLAEWGWGRVVVEGGGQTRAQQAILEADKEQGGSEPDIGDAVAMAAWAAFDHAMETKAAQLIADRRVGWCRVTDRRGQPDKGAKIGGPEAVGQRAEEDDGVP